MMEYNKRAVFEAALTSQGEEAAPQLRAIALNSAIRLNVVMGLGSAGKTSIEGPWIEDTEEQAPRIDLGPDRKSISTIEEYYVAFGDSVGKLARFTRRARSNWSGEYVFVASDVYHQANQQADLTYMIDREVLAKYPRDHPHHQVALKRIGKVWVDPAISIRGDRGWSAAEGFAVRPFADAIGIMVLGGPLHQWRGINVRKRLPKLPDNKILGFLEKNEMGIDEPDVEKIRNLVRNKMAAERFITGGAAMVLADAAEKADNKEIPQPEEVKLPESVLERIRDPKLDPYLKRARVDRVELEIFYRRMIPYAEHTLELLRFPENRRLVVLNMFIPGQRINWPQAFLEGHSPKDRVA